MRVRVPDYFDGFSCLAGACPHSCCIGWEVVLDEDTVRGALNALMRADLLIVGGTSLVVYPAAGLLRYFQGDSLVLINRDATQMDKMADLCIRDAIGAVMEQIQVPEKEA